MRWVSCSRPSSATTASYCSRFANSLVPCLIGDRCLPEVLGLSSICKGEGYCNPQLLLLLPLLGFCGFSCTLCCCLGELWPNPLHRLIQLSCVWTDETVNFGCACSLFVVCVEGNRRCPFRGCQQGLAAWPLCLTPPASPVTAHCLAATAHFGHIAPSLAPLGKLPDTCCSHVWTKRATFKPPISPTHAITKGESS
jgi:hypothetical protein